MTRLEHIGIAVADPSAVADLLDRLLGRMPYKREEVLREGVATHFISAGSAKLELLEALWPDSPVARFLGRRGPGLHHLAFEVPDIDEQMAHVRALGLTPLSDEPRSGADGKRIFFLHPRDTHGVLVEFCQSVPTPLPYSEVPWRGGGLATYALGNAPGAPLVVLPPIGRATVRDLEPLLRRLEPLVAVHALDFAGHGASVDFAESGASLDDHADGVRAVLDAAGVERAHVVALGGAAVIAHRFLRRYPERIAGLILMGPDDASTVLVQEQTAHLDHFAGMVVGFDGDGGVPLRAALRLHRALSGFRLAVVPGALLPLTEAVLSVLVPLLVSYATNASQA